MRTHTSLPTCPHSWASMCPARWVAAWQRVVPATRAALPGFFVFAALCAPSRVPACKPRRAHAAFGLPSPQVPSFLYNSEVEILPPTPEQLAANNGSLDANGVGSLGCAVAQNALMSGVVVSGARVAHRSRREKAAAAAAGTWCGLHLSSCVGLHPALPAGRCLGWRGVARSLLRRLPAAGVGANGRWLHHAQSHRHRLQCIQLLQQAGRLQVRCQRVVPCPSRSGPADGLPMLPCPALQCLA